MRTRVINLVLLISILGLVGCGKKEPEVVPQVGIQYDKPETEGSEEETETEKINPWLLKFLDAENFDEKYKIVCDMHRDVDDRLIDDIAVVMDVVIPEGKLSERYAQLKYCIRTRQHYEQSRFR